MPQIGDQYIVTDWYGHANAIIETTAVIQTPFHEITPEFARIEGEGDGSLDYWKNVHQAYYTREMAPYEQVFSPDLVIVCAHFKTIYTAVKR